MRPGLLTLLRPTMHHPNLYSYVDDDVENEND